MALGLIKWFEETSFYERKNLLQKHELCTKGKFILRREEGLMNFRIIEKLMF